MTTSTRTSHSTWAGTGLVWLICLVIWSGCTPRPSAVVIPDSQELRPAWVCIDDGKNCRIEPERITLTVGYLRDILRTFEECRK